MERPFRAFAPEVRPASWEIRAERLPPV